MGDHSMRLSQYRTLIASLPVHQQSFTSKRRTWGQNIPAEMAGLFGSSAALTMSRGDVFAIAKTTPPDIRRLVYAVILWGYPAGGRGKNFERMVAKMDVLEGLLSKIRVQNGNEIPDWSAHWNEAFREVRSANRIDGVGLSTYSKMLYFLRARVNGHPCLILDNVLMEVFNAGKFDEFAHLETIRYDNAWQHYPAYLKSMADEATNLDVSGDSLEMFLFTFGPILKA